MKRPLAAASALALSATTAIASPPKPPRAKRQFHEHSEHGVKRSDPYFWLRERKSPEVREYLEAENTYMKKRFKPARALEKKLFKEFKSRIKDDKTTAPFRHGDFFYYNRYVKGGEYPLFCRKKGSLGAPEEILLDGNAMAKGHDYYSMGAVEISPDHTKIAYAVDTVGRRIHTIYFRDLTTGEDLPDKIEGATKNLVWANDNATIFYAKQHPKTLRWDEIYRYRLGSGAPVRVFREDDETFYAGVDRTASGKFLLIGSTAKMTHEFWVLPADQPEAKPVLFAARRRGHEYTPDHAGDRWVIHSNDGAQNFKIMEAAEDSTDEASWKTLIAHDEDVFIAGIQPFQNFFAVAERAEGMKRIRVLPRGEGAPFTIQFDDASYDASIGTNLLFDTPLLRVGYESMNRPKTAYDYDMTTKEKTTVWMDPVEGVFSPEDYGTERLWATAPDGEKVPVSLVFKKDTKKNGRNPLLLYGYGSYGHSTDAWFSKIRLSLLDRGVVFAIAHVRGGQEMGRRWYEEGRLKKKQNTFSDFIAVADFLVQEKWTSPEHLYAMGGSAGGLLMGAIANQRPELFNGILSFVPFVDVVTTMFDDSLPLTTAEYDEWGNPNRKEDFDVMLAYSPYDNIRPQDYPNILVQTGFHDSQVQYWEPAKYVARLRAMKTGNSLLLFKTDLDSGHSGKTGRYKSLWNYATAYAFMLALENGTLK